MNAASSLQLPEYPERIARDNVAPLISHLMSYESVLCPREPLSILYTEYDTLPRRNEATSDVDHDVDSLFAPAMPAHSVFGPLT